MRVQPNDIAHVFPKGHCIRLTAQTNCRPHVLPAPEPVTLTVFSGTSILDLPVRPRQPGDKRLRPFARPETAAPMTVTTLRPYHRGRRLARDFVSGETVVEMVKDRGEHTLHDIAVTYAGGGCERYVIGEDVKFSLEHMGESEWKDKAVALDHVEVAGTHSGTIHLNQPFAPIWYTWICDGTGTIVSKKAIEAADGTCDGTQWCWMGLNVNHSNLQDIRVRQAIQYAVDGDTIIRDAWAGVPTRAYDIVPPGLIGYREDGKYMTPDPDKTRELIAEAGAEGTKITLKTINLADRMAAAQIIRANLAMSGWRLKSCRWMPGLSGTSAWRPKVRTGRTWKCGSCSTATRPTPAR